MRKALGILIAGLVLSTGMAGQSPQTPQRQMLPPLAQIEAPAESNAIPLYPGAAPGSERTMPVERWETFPGPNARVVRNVTRPTLTPFLPPEGKGTGAAMIVAPGGAFVMLSIDSEGYDVARWLADHGIAAFVLKYRLRPTSPDPQAFFGELAAIMKGVGNRNPGAAAEAPQATAEATADGQAAIALVRSRAREWGIDPSRVGFVGFSAGAMTALSVALAPDASRRPDFVAPIYGPMSHQAVPAGAPPLFTAVAADDPLFGGSQADLVHDWLAAKRPAELHVFERGGHGFGMKTQGSSSDHWIQEMLWWMQAKGLDQYSFRDPSAPIESRIDKVLSLMTLDEKIAILGRTIAVPRLGIRGTGIGEAMSGVLLGTLYEPLIADAMANPMALLKQMKEAGISVPMDAAAAGSAMSRPKSVPSTQFPEGVGIGRTWNPSLVRQAGAVIGREARYAYENGTTSAAALVLLTPNADLARDPRWGRTQESYGEDPFFNGTIATALITGLQGDDPRHWQAASLLKHFLANSNERGRYGSSSDFDMRLFREYYSVPFRMGFVEGGARSYMTSYNAWNKVPMTSHPVIRDITMREWGVDGVICTDAGGFGFQVTKHKFYPARREATAATIKAGINLFLLDNVTKDVKAAIEDKSLTEADLDAVLRGSLRTLVRLGLLDPPSAVSYARLKGAPNPVDSDEHHAIARQVSLESVVLLKNTNRMLPLDRRTLKAIAVIGPLADKVLMEGYSGTPPYTVSPLEGIRKKAGAGVTVNFAADNSNGAAAEAARKSDVAVVVVGNHPLCGPYKGALVGLMVDDANCPAPGEAMENHDRKSIDLPQEQLIQEVFRANPKTVVVLVSGFPYAINWTQQHVPAILHTSHSGQEEGAALAEVLFGDYSPAGRLVQTWPKSLSQLPPMMDYDIRHGRTYMYFKGKPLYPFGYGLSYTTFKHSNLRTSAPILPANGQLIVSVDVMNTGPRDGDEIVQLYVKHLGSKVARPRKELRGFGRVHLARGQTKTVQIPLKAESLGYWDDAKHGFAVEEEPLLLMVGSSSADVKAQRTVRVRR
jgi:beta-glucosidase